MSESTDLMAYIQTRWFAPVVERVEDFEDNADVFESVLSVAEPQSADWAVQCVIKTIKPFGDLTGMPFDGQFESHHVGALIGAKSSICAAMADSHRISQQWKAESWQKLAEFGGQEAIVHAKRTWKRFAESLQSFIAAEQKVLPLCGSLGKPSAKPPQRQNVTLRVAGQFMFSRLLGWRR